MARRVPRFLLTGKPGAGKTTLVSRLIDRLQAAEAPVGGFVTREIREHGQRIGFTVESIGGETATMAHTGWGSGPRVGRYHVNVAAFERVALPAMAGAASRGGVVVLDELGPMELHSKAFVQAVQRILGQDVPLVATVHARAHPVTDAIKRRPGVELLTVTRENQAELLTMVTAQLLADRAGGPPHDLISGSDRAAGASLQTFTDRANKGTKRS